MFVENYLELNQEVSSERIASYKTLTLARHIFISTLFEDRKAFTEKLLELCEERLDVTQGVFVATK